MPPARTQEYRHEKGPSGDHGAVALSGISVAAADVSTWPCGYHYDSWSDDKTDTDTGKNNNATSGDLQLWVNGKTTTDLGLTYEVAVRFRDKR